jgi:ArsR family transcriptional regulator
MCQIKDMSNNDGGTGRPAGCGDCPPDVAGAADCCAPLACEPLQESGAEELARLFKAVADPVRLRLLSLIACHEGGESCGRRG